MQLAIIYKYICANGFDWSTRYIMSIMVSNCQHYDEQQFQNTVMCILHDFLSSKVRFIHTSIVTGPDSGLENILMVLLVKPILQSTGEHIFMAY